MTNEQTRTAFGTFIFKDAGYLPGLLLVAYKLRKLSSNHPKLIALHTPDISTDAVELLKKLYDDVIEVDYLKFGRKRTGRQAPLPFMFTRFRFLQLNAHYRPEEQIDKVLVLDADMLPISSFDALLDLPTPAGVINESKDKILGSLVTKAYIEKWEWHRTYEPLLLKGKLPKYITDRPITNPESNMGINGGLMLLQPSTSSFETFVSWCEQNMDSVNKMPWPDMQSITAYYSGQWTSIDAKYLGLYGYPNIESLKGIHFIGPKPWQYKAKGFEYRLNKHPDHRLWAKEFLTMCEQMPELLKFKGLSRLKNAIELALK